MKFALSVAFSLVAASVATAQGNTDAILSPGTTLPIRFSHGVSAAHAKMGEVVEARTTQPIHLAGGRIIPAGAKVTGTVVTAEAFVFDKTHYADQKNATLSIQFNALVTKQLQIPLNVYVRAIADPLAVQDALLPNVYDDSLRTRRQIGGDYVTPSQNEVVSSSGRTVGYLKHGDVYAHLIPSTGNSPDSCDGGKTEQPMGLFAASACGAYGFTDASLVATGRRDGSSTLTLVSDTYSPQIWANSIALLEVQARVSSNVEPHASSLTSR